MDNEVNGTRSNNDEVFLQELRAEYNQLFELKNALDNKTNSLITVSIISASLLVSIGSLLLSRIQPAYAILPFTVGLIIGIGLSVFSILFCMRAYKLRGFMFSIVSENFFDQKGEYLESRTEKVRNDKQEVFYKNRIKNYLDCIRHNGSQNDKKAQMIITSQKLFIIAVCFLLGVMMALLLLLVTGYASVNPFTMSR